MSEVAPSMVALSYWQRRHQEIIGSPYMTQFGKDNKIMKDIIATYDLEKTYKFIDLFFGMLMVDSFLQQSGASVGVFKTQIPKLLMQEKTQIEEKKKENTGRL